MSYIQGELSLMGTIQYFRKNDTVDRYSSNTKTALTLVFNLATY